jgi:hypothetical protein
MEEQVVLLVRQTTQQRLVVEVLGFMAAGEVKRVSTLQRAKVAEEVEEVLTMLQEQVRLLHKAAQERLVLLLEVLSPILKMLIFFPVLTSALVVLVVTTQQAWAVVQVEWC